MPIGTSRPVSWLLGLLAVVWLWTTQWRFRRNARPLNEQERATFGTFFSSDLLSVVRVLEVPRITLPLAWMGELLVGGTNILREPGGIALGSLVVIARGEFDAAETSSNRRASILFHELVHVAQYRTLGIRGFLTCYLRGWFENERDYFSIPLEVQAYDLQNRFDRGVLGTDEVSQEIARWCLRTR